MVDRVKIKRPSQLALTQRIHSYFSLDSTSILNFENYQLGDNVQYHVKIGRVTDNDLLRSIQNSEANCLGDLLNYAKRANAVYETNLSKGQTEGITKNFTIIDDAKVGKIVYGKKVLADTAHMDDVVEKNQVTIALIAIPSSSKKDIRRIYDLCNNLNLETKIMKQSDALLENPEEAKHYPIEDIMLYQGLVSSASNIYSLINYLDADFVWNLKEETPQTNNNITINQTTNTTNTTSNQPTNITGNLDNTKAPGTIPQTGSIPFTTICILAVILGIGGVAYYHNRKYQGL